MFRFLFLIVTIAATSFSAFAQIPQGGQIELNTEKKPGVIRIGIVSPVAEMGKDFSYADTPMAVRNTLEVALKEDHTETLFLDSALPDKEARLKKCDYIFHSRVIRKKGGGGWGGMAGLGMLAGAAGMIPGAGGVVGSVAASAASTAISVASMSGGFKSKDEVTFEYRLTSVDGTVLIPTTATKQKAKKDGEDVLTPQIADAAKTALVKISTP